MFNDSLLSLSFSELNGFLLSDLSLFNIAITYTLVYVMYKALGRYVYFKPEEHASKVNRTFLFVSIYIILIHFFSSKVLWSIMIPPQYMWLYTLSVLVLITGLLSIIFRRIVYSGISHERDWVHNYLPINAESFKSSTSRSEEKGNYSTSWNEETISYTNRNRHSDMMLNSIALTIFISTNINWILNIQELSHVFFASICAISITVIFVDQGIFKWMYLLRNRFS